MTRPWSPVQIKQWSKLDSKKPKDQTWEDGKLRGPSQKSVESCGTRSFIQSGEKLTTRDHMQKGEGSRMAGPKWAQARRPSPFQGPVSLPLDLAASRAIYSPLTESHGRTSSSSVAEEQRSLRDTTSGRRVVLVVEGLSSRRGNLAWKTMSELQSLDQDRGRIPVVILFM
jgi:hypothetical protein